jgi:hypothetical protein
MYETMIPPMLMVEKIIRTKETGQILFESAIIDKDRTEIIGKFVETTYQLKHWEHSWNNIEQLIPDEALVVAAFAIAVATKGMGAGLLGVATEGTIAAAVNAGFSAVCASAGTSLLRTGDPLQTVKQTFSSTQLKSIAISMASAGVCDKLGGMLDINMLPEIKSFTEHVSEHALRSTIDTLLNVAINHTSVDKALGEAVKEIPLKAAASYAANQICMNCTDVISRKATHTALGGLSGFAMEHNRDGFVSGAIGALTAETVGDILISDVHTFAKNAHEKLIKAGKPLTQENIDNAIAAEVQAKTNLAKLAAGTAAVLTKQNPSIALATGSNVIDNDVAIRGKLYALEEFQAMVTAASQAFVTLNAHEEIFEPQYQELQELAEEDKDKAERIKHPEGKPFVKDPDAGEWFSACISDDLKLINKEDDRFYLYHRMRWHKHPKCPFAVSGHGSPSSMELSNKDIHPQGLSEFNMRKLQEDGYVNLNVFEIAKLIETAPNYKKGQHIVLFSCECGARNEGLAQQLADMMNVPVSAFTGLATMTRFKFYSTSDENWTSLKEIKTFFPREEMKTNIPNWDM